MADDDAQDDGEALEGLDSLSDEIVRKWDPERILRMVAKRAGKGERLDEATRQKYERRLGVDLSHVRVYTGELAEEVTRAHSASAVTIGDTGMIMMGGQPEKSLAGTEGWATLAHELTHVAQAQRGMHRQATFGEATPLATEEHEQEAEQAEAEEHGESSGDGEPEGEKQMRLMEKVTARVKELFAESMRVELMRNGDPRYRP